MSKFQTLYYASVAVFCAIATVAVGVARVYQKTDTLSPLRTSVMNKTNYATDDQKNMTVVKKQQRMVLYLPAVPVVGCSSLASARQIAQVFANVGTDPVHAAAAYDVYWRTEQCTVYTDGVSLEADFPQVSFATKQHTMVRVFEAEEGEVESKAFQGTMYIVMMNPNVRANIFSCEHNINSETGFDTIDLCRPNI